MHTPVSYATSGRGASGVLRRSSSLGSICLLALALGGCPSSTTSSSSAVVTGVEILAETVAGSHGCGKGAGQVYRYTAVVYHGGTSDGSTAVTASDAAIASNLFECYADGLFSNLPASDSGSALYVVRVYAYGYAAFQKNAAVAALQCPASTAPPCPAESPAVVTAPEVTGAADYTLDCTAIEQQGVPVLARCTETPSAFGTADSGADAGARDAAANETGQLDGASEASQVDL
ncbi:MAG: hypothetical protein M3O50_06040 [Myxococcota bacterium]|nr:hypothetical protein [Myxococcota bacterium]